MLLPVFLFALIPCIQLLLFMQPCWTLHLLCKKACASNLGPAGDEAEHLPSPSPTTCLLMDSQHHNSPQLCRPWKTPEDFPPILKKKKKNSFRFVSPEWPWFTAVQMACGVRCNIPANSSGLTGKIRWNRKFFIQNDLCRCMSLCVCGISTAIKLYPCNRVRF